jgi:hypothetical protein
MVIGSLWFLVLDMVRKKDRLKVYQFIGCNQNG